MVHKTARSPRARRHDANLGRILDSALALIAEDGLPGLSMSKLADAAAYTPGALYRYFPSKDALLSQLVVRILGEIREHQLDTLARLPASSTPLVRVFALAAAYRAFAAAQPHRFGLLAATQADPKVLIAAREHAEPVTFAVMAAMQPLSEQIAAAASTGQLARGDLAERTLLLFGLIQGLLPLAKSTPKAPGILDVDRLVARGTRALLLGWGGKARTVDTALARFESLVDGTATADAS